MKQNTEFVPMRLPVLPDKDNNPLKLTITTTVRGSIVTDFEDLAREYGLNRSQLLAQMVHHCLGKTEELKDFYKRLAILG